MKKNSSEEFTALGGKNIPEYLNNVSKTLFQHEESRFPTSVVIMDDLKVEVIGN